MTLQDNKNSKPNELYYELTIVVHDYMENINF